MHCTHLLLNRPWSPFVGRLVHSKLYFIQLARGKDIFLYKNFVPHLFYTRIPHRDKALNFDQYFFYMSYYFNNPVASFSSITGQQNNVLILASICYHNPAVHRPTPCFIIRNISTWLTIHWWRSRQQYRVTFWNHILIFREIFHAPYI